MIETIEVEGATVIFLTGDLDEASCGAVRDWVRNVIEAGRRVLVIDLSGVRRMYAVGLSLLVELQQAAQAAGGRLICCGARPFAREILRLHMLDRTLDLQMDLDGALNLLTPAS